MKTEIYWILPSVYGDEADELQGATLDVVVLKSAANEDRETACEEAMADNEAV